jgi:hypothetical protein
MELDPRISSESDFQPDWPPYLIAIPPMVIGRRRRISDGVFLAMFIVFTIILYGSAIMINLNGMVQ